jgi:hypothetical protein
MDMPADPARDALEQPNVATALSWQARRQPNGSAVHYLRAGAFRGGDYASCTFQELDELSESYSRGLTACGIGPGVRSALLLTPDLDCIAVLHALFKLGAVPVLIDPGVGMTAMERCLAESSTRAVVAATRAHFARKLLGRAKDHCELLVTAGSTWGRGAISLRKLRQMGDLATEPVLHKARPDDAAAVLFTSGTTGEPKGVVYRHRHFNAQLGMLRRTYGIQPGEVSLSAFPPLALFDTALGMTTVIPELDPTRPAEADACRPGSPTGKRDAGRLRRGASAAPRRAPDAAIGLSRRAGVFRIRGDRMPANQQHRGGPDRRQAGRPDRVRRRALHRSAGGADRGSRHQDQRHALSRPV